jgi:hypothetical protein
VTIHLITVGNSIRTKLAERFSTEPDLASGKDLHDAALLGLEDPDPDPDEVAEFLSLVASRDDTDGVRTARATAESAWHRLQAFGGGEASGWESTISAESSSLIADNENGWHSVTDRDLFVLLTSQTSDGMLAAFWNALHLAGSHDPLSLLDFGGVGEVANGLSERHRVRIQVIRHLDLRNPQRFPDAMRHLAQFARAALVERGAGENVVVHLSGGYKATIPFLIGIAEGMRSVQIPERSPVANVRAVVVHEDSFADGRPEGVPIPLRTLVEDDLRTELAPFHEGRARISTLEGSTSLLGYAYVEEASGWYKLTEFGHGLRVFIAPPAQGSQ